MKRFVRSYKIRKQFLDSLETGSSPTAAARSTGHSLQCFKTWRKSDEDFAKDWDDAIDEGTDFIEDVATDRALAKSDALMAMILKARRPEKYDRAGKLELSGGISVEGAKAKLLNRIARLQANTPLPQESSEEEPKVLEGARTLSEPARLPSPDSR